jgi:hypothetical protein
MAGLAAQTAVSLTELEQRSSKDAAHASGQDGAEAGVAAEVTDTLLTVVEACVAAADELGVGEHASHALLNIAIALARCLLPLLALAGERQEAALADLLPRLQALMVG